MSNKQKGPFKVQQQLRVHAPTVTAILGYLENPRSASYDRFVHSLNLARHDPGADYFSRKKVGFASIGTRTKIIVRRFHDAKVADDGKTKIIPNKKRDRWFTVDVNIEAGDTAGKIGFKIRDAISDLRREKEKNGSAPTDPGDDDYDNFEIFRVDKLETFGYRRAKPRGFSRAPEYQEYVRYRNEEEQLDSAFVVSEEDIARGGGNEDVKSEDSEDDELDELKRASHTYQPVPLEQFAMHPLIMRDFTCIYESLMVILWHSEMGRVPHVAGTDWRLYVLLHFNAEPLAVQHIFWDYYIWRGMTYFTNKYGINVGLFDAHHFAEEMRKIKAVADFDENILPRYYLVYFGEHVFPCLRENLQQIVDCQEGLLKRAVAAKGILRSYAIVPPLLNYLSVEIKLSLFGAGAHPETGEYLFRELAGVDIMTSVIAGSQLTDKKATVVSKQQYVLNQLAEAKAAFTDDGDYLDALQYKYTGLSGDLVTAAQTVVPRLETLVHKTTTYKGRLFYAPAEIEHYNKLQYYVGEQCMGDKELEKELRKELCAKNRLLKFGEHRARRFDEEMGIAVIDIETYMDNDIENSQTLYNMVPFCLTLVGNLQQMTVDRHYRPNGAFHLEQRVRLVKGIRKVFMGFHPRECAAKLINYLIDNCFCYSYADYRKLNGYTASMKQKQLFNNIFAHNGFGFDYLQLYEELHSKMREFKLVGDMQHTKLISGNGLFFYDFALIYPQRLKTLAEKFFPDYAALHKKECTLVIGLEKEVLQGWYTECNLRRIKPEQHPQLGEIIEYCMRDSVVLYEIVCVFFRRVYTTPFGHGFMPRPFYHSLSSLAYTMFTQCYLRKPIFTNRHAFKLELASKRGGITAANCNRFGFGVFIDENSFYPAVMLNPMPVEYELGIEEDPFEVFADPLHITKENVEQHIVPHNLYRVTYHFGEEVRLPTIATKSADTLILVRSSRNFFENRTHDNAYAVMLFGIELIVAMQETESCYALVFGYIRYKDGDAIFREFVVDYYTQRYACKRRGDEIGDIFHKNMMNSPQGKFGQKYYEQCKMGSVQFVNDLIKHLQQEGRIVGEPKIKYMLTNNVDLFEVKWTEMGDDLSQTGNTVRIPSYIMAIARSYLLRVQNRIAKAFGDADCIGYYDTDSILTRFDLFNARLDAFIQETFDNYLLFCEKHKPLQKEQSMATRIAVHWIKYGYAQVIGQLICSSPEFECMRELTVPDCTNLKSTEPLPLLDEYRLGACKIEKFVIRGISEGAKLYCVYFLELAKGVFRFRQAVKIKGVREDCRKMNIFEKIDENMREFDVRQDLPLDPTKMPVVLSDVMDKWSRMGAGVILSKLRKYVRPTLTKRRHDFLRTTSVPFADEEEFQKHKNEYELRMQEAKDIFMGSPEHLGQQVIEQLAVSKLKEATRVQNSLRSEARSYFKQCMSTLAEGRKRYLIRLQKIKFNCVQDTVLRLLLTDAETLRMAAVYIPKLESISLQAIALRKYHKKKGIFSAKDEERGLKMSLQVSARSMAYVLFCYYLLRYKEQVHKIDVPDALEAIVKHLAREVLHRLLKGTDYVKEQEKAPRKDAKGFSLHSWKFSLAYAFEFLQAGVSCYDKPRDSVFADCCTEDESMSIDLGVPLTQKITYTSLWRFLNNFQNRLQQLGGNAESFMNASAADGNYWQQQDYEEEKKQPEMEQIDTSIMRGPPSLHAILTTDFTNTRGTQVQHEYDLLNNIAKEDGVTLDYMAGMKRNRKPPKEFDVPDDEVCQHVPKRIGKEIRKRGVMVIQYEHINDDQLVGDYKGNLDRRLAQVVLMHQLMQVPRTGIVDEDEPVNTALDSTLYKILQRVCSGNPHEFTSTEYLYSLFAVRVIRGENVKKVIKEDMFDIVILYLFLLSGRRRASSIMRKLNDDLQSRYNYTNSFSKRFVRCCYIIFGREKMFQTFEIASRLSKRTEQVLKDLLAFTVHYDASAYTSDEKYLAELNNLLDDAYSLTPAMRQLLQAVRDEPELRELGEKIFEKALLWREPTPQMMLTLKSMLLLEEDIYTDRAEQLDFVITEQLYANDEQLARDFFYLQNSRGGFKELFDLAAYGKDLLPEEEQSLNIPAADERSERINLAEELARVDEEDNRAWFYQAMRGVDLAPGDEAFDDDLAHSYESHIIRTDKRQREQNKAAGRFFEFEAEEGDEDEDEEQQSFDYFL